MLTDAHCHPFDLARFFPGAEEGRRQMGVFCAASATDREEFEYNEALAHKAKSENAVGVLPCFAIHPQMPVNGGSGNRDCCSIKKHGSNTIRLRTKTPVPDPYSPVSPRSLFNNNIALLEELARQGRLAAVGETGFDLYNSSYRETEAIQDELFAIHLEIALRYGLPLVLHIRRAMHKVFGATAKLKKCQAVVFHSWPGTVGEGQALLRRGINAFFSFGTTIMLKHREAMRCCSSFPAERLLLETDAPFQPLKSRPYSSWSDLPLILASAAALRHESGAAASDPAELEKQIEANFITAFNTSR
jgi:TatD DNase family protein